MHRFLSVSDVAKREHMSCSAVRALIARGTLGAIHRSGRWFVPVAVYEAWSGNPDRAVRSRKLVR